MKVKQRSETTLLTVQRVILLLFKALVHTTVKSGVMFRVRIFERFCAPLFRRIKDDMIVSCHYFSEAYLLRKREVYKNGHGA